MQQSIRPTPKQAGFTLLELMVALAIFAVMAMLGWQIMDSLTKSRDRAKTKIATVRALQYAYETLAQDLAQTSNYVAVPPMAGAGAVIGTGTGTAAGLTNANLTPTFILNNQGIVLTRLAPPDPRLTASPALARMGYSVVDNQLIKSQFSTLLPSRADNATTSVLLNDISDAKWTAFTPDPVTAFPDMASLQKPVTTAVPTLPNTTTATNNSQTQPTPPSLTIDISAYQQLPKGIELQFTYQQIPIVWRFALPEGSPTNTGVTATTTGGK